MRLTVVSTGCGQVGQINFLDGIDRSEEKERWYREKAATYKEWLTLPEKTFIRGVTPERENLASILLNGLGELYQYAHHECKNMPEDEYIWMNSVEDNYWVRRKPGVMEGEHVKICPYCGADLAGGKGDAVLYKAEPKYWAFYTGRE